MDNPIDLLQIKIEKAKANLPEETLNAINAVPWKITILEMRTKKGYSFEQLGDLETETELLLCGLLNPEDYPKELEKRMRISKTEAEGLVKEMNELVFAKIREEFIKNSEKKKKEKEVSLPIPIKTSIYPAKISVQTDIEIGKPEITPPPGILAQKLGGTFQIPTAKTDHSLTNVRTSKIDPYRITPEE